MTRWLFNFLVRFSGYIKFQSLLERNVALSQSLMGIGIGGAPETSGEKVLIEKLKEHYQSRKHSLYIFDVGSNKGQFSDLIVTGLQNFDIPFTVHAFEPSRETFSILFEKFNSNKQVVLNNFGLGRESGIHELFYDNIGSGLASLSKRRLDHFNIRFEKSEQVKIQTLDIYCDSQAIDQIDLLKIDVEGHELDVLSGCSEMLRKQKVKMISFEFGGGNIDTRIFFQDFWYFFQQYGPKIFRILPSGHLLPISTYHENYEQFRTTNYLVLLPTSESF